jgi:FG-GAP repeat
MRGFRVLRLAGALALTAGAAAAGPSHAALLPGNSDFNDDGISDLAIGAPADSVRGLEAAGAINVIFGGASGLSAADDVQFTQSDCTQSDVPERGDRFGAALAPGDFDGDGTGDLAIGAPGEGVRTGLGPDEQDRPGAGIVHVLYGDEDGLLSRCGDTWTQDRPGIKGVTGAGDGFGSALVAGDFDGDGRDDLAIGSPGDGVGGHAGAGAVNVLCGTRSGLSEAGDQLWTLDSAGVKGLAGRDFGFGSALAAGDLSRNGRDELAIGVPGGRISGHAAAGAVLVLYGRASGLSSVDDLWSQDSRGIKGVAAADDRFGAAVAIDDFDRDRAGDLAAGVPGDEVGEVPDGGAVNVIHGSSRGLREDPDRRWTQDSRGIKGVAQAGDLFGSALVAADFSSDAVGDLAIGVPGQATGGRTDAGALNVLYGADDRGLVERGDRELSRRSRGIEGRAEPGDRFGAALTAGDYDADNAFDLTVGVPGATVDGRRRAGAVNVIHGSRAGLREDPDQLWTQGAGIVGAVGADAFGAAVAGGSR